MSELLWTCEEGAVFKTEMAGLRLVVVRSPIGGGYRYQLLRPAATPDAKVSLASGYREDLREAIDAAERTASGFASRQGRRPMAGVGLR
ncbi:MAG: hypothetical protein JOZ05_06050 [Acetobacteraceae bacterium]|nr:hypothetical protein [Acetobacteraceae bacterium]